MSFATPRPIMLFDVDEIGVFLEVAAKDKRSRSSVYMSMIKQDSGRSTTQNCMNFFFREPIRLKQHSLFCRVILTLWKANRCQNLGARELSINEGQAFVLKCL